MDKIKNKYKSVGRLFVSKNLYNFVLNELLRKTKITGTISVVNKTVTGTNTIFTNELLIGDTLLFVTPTNIFYREIIKINNNKSLTIDNTVGGTVIGNTFLIKIQTQLLLISTLYNKRIFKLLYLLFI